VAAFLGELLAIRLAGPESGPMNGLLNQKGLTGRYGVGRVTAARGTVVPGTIRRNDPMSLIKKLAKRMFSEPEMPPELGRNEPCWCGSGRKYKHCHLERDERKRSARRAGTLNGSQPSMF